MESKTAEKIKTIIVYGIVVYVVIGILIGLRSDYLRANGPWVFAKGVVHQYNTKGSRFSNKLLYSYEINGEEFEGRLAVQRSRDKKHIGDTPYIELIGKEFFVKVYINNYDISELLLKFPYEENFNIEKRYDFE